MSGDAILSLSVGGLYILILIPTIIETRKAAKETRAHHQLLRGCEARWNTIADQYERTEATWLAVEQTWRDINDGVDDVVLHAPQVARSS